MNKKILKLLLLPCLILPSVSCGNKTSTDTSYLSEDLIEYSYLIEDANKYLNSTTSKLLYNYHDSENNVDFCIIEANEIQYESKSETFKISNSDYILTFIYDYNRQMFFVKDHNVYTLKNAFLDLKVSLDDLYYVHSLYACDFDFDDDSNASSSKLEEIGGDPIELETHFNKSLIDGYSSFQNYGPGIAVEIDPVFYNHTFTLEDFKGIDVSSISRYKYGNADGGASITYGDNCKKTAPVYVLELKDQSKEHILRTIFDLKQRYYVVDAFLNGHGFLYFC